MAVVKILVILLLTLCLYSSSGMIIVKLCKIRLHKCEELLAGFFGCYGLFQIIYLPIVFGQGSLTLLSRLWLVMMVLILAAGFLTLKGRKKTQMPHFTGNRLLLALFVFVLLFELFYMLNGEYNGWDTAYYIGNMTTSLKTDTMYVFDGNTGVKLSELPLRYALSGFYMQGAVWCRLLDLHPLLYCHYVTPVFGWAFSNLIMYEIATQTVGKENENNRYLFVIFACLINFSFNSPYTTSEFLLTRSIEAKSYCANIIIPSIFLLTIRLKENWEEKTYWILLFIVSVAADTVSFSALLIVPVLLTIICLTGILIERNFRLIRYYFVCMICPVLYGAAYLAYVKGFLSILVRQ